MAVEKAYTASGTIYGALLDANKNKVGGYVEMGNAFPFSIEVKLTSKKQKSAQRGQRGQIVHSGAIIDEVVGSISLKNWIAKNLAMLLSGSATLDSTTSGTVTAEAVVLPVSGEWVKLAYTNVSAVTIDTYTEGEDFEVNPRLGMIRNLTATEIDGDADYSYAAGTGYKIDIATQTAIRMAILVDGKNEEDGAGFVAEFDSVVFVPKSAHNIISEPETDYENMEFDLTFETVTGKSCPGTINGFAIA